MLAADIGELRGRRLWHGTAPHIQAVDPGGADGGPIDFRPCRRSDGRQAAAREGRSPSQITASSLRFYLALPAAVRASLRDTEALGTDEDRHKLMRAIARTIASAQYQVARRRAAEGMGLDHEEAQVTDEGILAEAVRTTTDD